MCKGPLRFMISFPVKNSTVTRGTQQAVKTLIAIASVEATRISLPYVSFTERVRAPSCFLFFLWWNKNTEIKKKKKKKK